MKTVANQWICALVIASSLFAGCGKDESQNSATSAPKESSKPAADAPRELATKPPARALKQQNSAASAPQEPSKPAVDVPRELASKPVARASQRRSNQLRIEYKYKGAEEVIGIPGGATAFDGDKRVAEAKFIKIIKKEPGPNHMEIEETYFSDAGDITYQGTVIMQFAFGGARVVEVKPISGTRGSPVFNSWPSGN